MKITDVLNKDCILIDEVVADKTEALEKLLRRLNAVGKLSDYAAARKAVFERESIMSTGIGNGFALPHGKTNAVNETVCAMMLIRDPIEFEALDDQPVNVIFMLIGRENMVGLHLRLLSRISRLMSSDAFRLRLSECKTPESAFDLLVKEEAESFV